MAVGAILVGVVLVYALFFAGGHTDRGKNSISKNTVPDAARIDKAGPQARDYPGPAGGASSDPADKSTVAPKDDKSILVPPRIDAGDSTTSKDKPAAPDPSGTDNANDLTSVKNFRWDIALKGGASAALVAHSETPSTPDRNPIPAEPTRVSKLADPATQVAHTYLVKQGDTFWTIAQAEYGDGTYYSHLMRANPNIAPNHLRAGVTIKVPGKGEVVPASAAARLAQAGPTTRPIDARQEYRVGPGESLYAISKKLYGRTDKVNQIYDLNKDLIGPNPAALKRGMVLRLPEPPSVTPLAGTPQ
jgi:nucleoid-associated protein YgaU